jgi:excisionase family DNA binding protein
MNNSKLTYSVPELAELLNIGRNAAYDLANREDFPAIRISPRRIIVPADRLEAWLAQQSGAARD